MSILLMAARSLISILFRAARSPYSLSVLLKAVRSPFSVLLRAARFLFSILRAARFPSSVLLRAARSTCSVFKGRSSGQVEFEDGVGGGVGWGVGSWSGQCWKRYWTVTEAELQGHPSNCPTFTFLNAGAFKHDSEAREH